MHDRIVIEALQVEALIGAYPHERAATQPLLLDLELEYDNRPAAASDAVIDAIDYAEVCKRARELASVLQPRLLETLAEALAADLLDTYATEAVRVRIRKPLAAQSLGAASVGVDIQRSRGRANSG